MDTLPLPKGEIFIAENRKASNYYPNLVKNYSPLILLCQKGNGHLTIDLNKCEVKENSLLFFLPGSIISYSGLNEDMEFPISSAFPNSFRKSPSVSSTHSLNI